VLASCCAVLCCAVLCCAVLCCAVLCCAVLCCVVLCCAELEESSRLPSAVDLYDKAIVLCGLSKSWGLPGLRLGWVASKDQQLLQQVRGCSTTSTHSHCPCGGLYCIKVTHHGVCDWETLAAK
jgi:hypothetical protein